MRHYGRFLGFLGFGLAAFVAMAPPVAAQQRTVTVQLAQQNASGVTGSATLTDLGNNQTRVEVRVTPAEGDHPAHIHMGTCANLTPAPEFPLTNVQNGVSTTVVNQSLASIQGTQRAINLHKSAADAATYVACGDIALVAAAAQPGRAAPAQVPGALPRTGDLPNRAPVFLSVGLLLGVAGLGLRKRFSRR